jgi:thiol-disulfide isomerase/thioredoxin
MNKVLYLESHDFHSNGNLKSYVNKGKPTIIIGTANFCGHCTTAKPAFEEFAKKNPKVQAAIIVSDNSPTEIQAGKLFKVWDPEHRGIPSYFGFNSDGVFSKVHNKGRSVQDLEKFAKSLM